MSEVALSLPVEPASIPQARRSLDRLAGAIEEDTLQDLRLLVSELLTNSVRHAGLSDDETIELRISVDAQRVRVEVRDAGPGFQLPDGPTTIFQESGWGLYLVDKLADRWGVISELGTTVWFEVDR